MERFLEAQSKNYEGYEMALEEIRNGRKQTHWIWYVFPQLAGFGSSWNSNYYGIMDFQEAREYAEHPILGKRLVEITEALLGLEETNATIIMGSSIDAKKLRSSMTLFSIVAPEVKVFEQVLDKYFNGEKDWKTVKLLA